MASIIKVDTIKDTGSNDIITSDGAGNVTVNTSLNFGDNDKAQFGASQDLQIYHDGSHSYINDVGTGNLYIYGSAFTVLGSTNAENGVIVQENGYTQLRYDNSSKLATTSTGVTVTGTLSATAFSGDGSALTGVGGGKVLQVVTATKTNTQTTNSSSFIDITGLSASITPSSTSSKILIQYVANIGCQTGTNRGAIQLVRGTTAIAIGDASSNRARVTATANSGNNDDVENLAGSWLDSPNTTSATTYKLQFRRAGSGSIHINRCENDSDNSNQFRISSSIILMEIGA